MRISTDLSKLSASDNEYDAEIDSGAEQGIHHRDRHKLVDIKHTLCVPLNTVAKLPFPISSSMRKDPTFGSPVLDRLDDEDGGG